MINLNKLRLFDFALAFLKKINAISFALILSRDLSPHFDSQHHTL